MSTDEKSNQDYYGGKVTPKQILFERQTPKVPTEAKALIDALP